MATLKDFISRIFGAGSTSTPASESANAMPTFPAGVTPWLVIGLGNPGAEYEATPHNVGYMAIDALLVRTGSHLAPLKGLHAHAAATELAGKPVLLVRSTTFMNESGIAVKDIAEHYSISLDQVIVVHDELDLPLGKVRVKQGGNENGHNGLKSTTEYIGSRDYLRVRMGISRPPQGVTVIDHVLGPIEAGPELDSMIDVAADAVTEIVNNGLAAAQQKIHSRK